MEKCIRDFPSTMAMSEGYFEQPLNMDRICRICLLEGANMTSIFATEQAVDEFSGLSQKIQVCGSVEIHENDGFPSLICDVCIYKASIAHEFRQQCQQSDARLRLLYNKPNENNNSESCTQTEPETNIIITRKIDSPTTTYYVKQELQNSNSQEYTHAIEAYTEPHRVETVRASHPAMDCQESKLFLCNIGFEGAKDITEKDANTILTVASQKVECPVDVQSDLTTTTTVLTVNANGELETQELIVKNDSEKSSAAVINEDYLNEQLMSSNDGVDDTVETDNGHFEEQQQDAILQQQQLQQGETIVKKRTSGRRVKSMSYSEDDTNDDYFPSNEDEDYFPSKPKYKCTVCLKSYATQKGLSNHKQVHESDHKCPICDKSFYNLKNMENHEKIHATRPHACTFCHASFSKLQSLVRHAKLHEKPETQEKTDLTCCEVMKNELELDKTEVRSEIESDLDADETNEIDEEFDSAPGLYKCEICGQFCSSMKNLRRHSLVHGEKKFSCTVCKKWFFRPDTLKRHAEKHGHGLLKNLDDENKLFDSDDENFSSPCIQSASNDASRIKEESDDEREHGEYKCQHCDKKMATKKGLRRHVSMHKPKAEPVTCDVCKKVCASQARLALHLKTHNKPKEKVQREYLCHICSKVYPSNSSLTYHMRTHTGVKPHVCNICNSGFTTTTSLANHIRIHTGDKPFVCHVCSAAFAVSSAFRRHLTRHTGEANYLCKTCGKAFKRLSTLKEHTYTHSGEKPYVCKTCGAAYSHSGSLFAHQKRCRVQYGEITEEHGVHHIHVNNVQTAVRSLAVIGQMY